VGSALADVRLKQIVSSPLERTLETAHAILDGQARLDDIALDARFGECHYGTWSGKKLSQLTKRTLWSTVQSRPSAVRFPGPDGESMVEMQARAVAAIHDWNRALGKSASYAVVSHGDVIKSILADALGMHLDMFQRIVVDPGSISVVQYGEGSSCVVRMNDTSDGRVEDAAQRRAPTVGGGSGPESDSALTD
jgi:probable phosphomutase (TIGR03848 family)